ncbi:uncharacterized protein LOC129234604 [Uloborus diversus]|uniref:uncharacterized protein LOC129234604 n=1 Tax=Uloborus diversus TaxID=327109 RepID=UPI002409BA26|nr:uncharacterized protein LOC129234604 [Uloborus diversus]
MFKKKAYLSARPPIPGREEIMDDFANASADDIAFKPPDKNQQLSISEKSHVDSKSKNEYLSSSDAYSKVDTFIQKIHLLNNEISLLEKQKESLKQLEESLTKDMDSMKKEMGKNVSS